METFPHHWSFVRGIHRSPDNSPHKGQWRGASVFSLISTWINGWINNHEADDLRPHRAHYDVNVMQWSKPKIWVKKKHTSTTMNWWSKHNKTEHNKPMCIFSWNTWWLHQMETFSALLALCARNSQVTGESPHKGQWRGALMFSLICAWINVWVNTREAGDLRRHRAHYDVIFIILYISHLPL